MTDTPTFVLLAEAPFSFAIIATVLIGVATGLLVYFGRSYYWMAIDWVERDFADKLWRMHIRTNRLRGYLVLWSWALVTLFIGFWLFAGSVAFALLSSVILFCGPYYLVRRMAERHRERIEEQLADSMVSMASAVKAGLSLAQAMEVLAEQSPRPIKAEFTRIVGEYEMGKPLDRTLEEANQRLRSENFALFSAALLASRESGGRLNETVERIAISVREMQRLERKVTSETAMARRSAVYMALAPLFILVLYYFVDPQAVGRLFVTVPGQLVLVAAVVLNIVAYLWARVILNPDI
ncbi:MAG: type II secretion system F family protein [Planctomycetota bacterium]|nr:type II secretion system F family protein [Planctomycetota bacterium]